MSTKHPSVIIRKPLLTEKGSRLTEEENKYVFEVSPNANKIEIRRAVEAIYEVTVNRVNTQIVRGKSKRVGRSVGRRKNWKKAIVQLSSDSTIDFFS